MLLLLLLLFRLISLARYKFLVKEDLVVLLVLNDLLT